MVTSEGTGEMPKRLMEPTPLRDRLANPEPFTTPVGVVVDRDSQIPDSIRANDDRLPPQPDFHPTGDQADAVCEQMREVAYQMDELSRKLRDAFDYYNMVIGGHAGRIANLEQPRREAHPVWPELMKRQTAAAYLDMSPGNLDRLVSEGHIKPYDAAGQSHRVYRRCDLDDYLGLDGISW